MTYKKVLSFEFLEKAAEDLYYYQVKRENRTITHQYKDLNAYTRSTYRQLAEIVVKKWENELG